MSRVFLLFKKCNYLSCHAFVYCSKNCNYLSCHAFVYRSKNCSYLSFHAFAYCSKNCNYLSCHAFFYCSKNVIISLVTRLFTVQKIVIIYLVTRLFTVHFTHSDISHFVLLGVFTLLFPYCDARHEFGMNTRFDSSLPPLICRRVHVIFFVIFCPKLCLTRLVYMSFMASVL